MNTKSHENIIVVGCGRVGAELANSISRKGLTVTIMDVDLRAFDRLPSDFGGRIVQGDALDQSALERAGITTAHGLAAVTTTDSANIVAARVARDVYHVEHVVARVYDPVRSTVYEKLGLQTIASSSWGAQRIEQLLLHPGLRSIHVAGNGEVQIYEISVPEHWHDRLLADLLPADQAAPVALTRGGRGHLPDASQVLHSQDILLISATADGAAAVLRQLAPHKKD